uniref:Peptidase S1 domain-containing protein n=1 Tax=Panagrolaimus sp. PS1159 TaxID=55785 RepID=A0AC35EWS6_9BILA
MIDIKALKVIKHSVFADTDMHDLALIKIKEIKYTEYLRPICLMSYEKILEGSKVVAVGSGLQLISLSEDAKKAEITVKSLEICTEIYKHWARSNENVLCAGTAFTGLRGGDSGGPLMANFQGRYYLIGITSAKKIGAFGDTFLQNKYPVLFSRIAPECDSFIGNNSNVKCLKNAVPLRITEEKELSCGEISESRRQQLFLTNGNDAILQPWFCKLFDKSKNVFCGGTLISFRHLLTAKSCVENIQQSEITIKCGIYFQTTSKISKIRKPENSIENSINDIAILEFKNKINFDGNVGVACLTKFDFMEIDNQQLTVIDQSPIKKFNQKSMKRGIQNISTCQTKVNSKTNNTVVICNKEIVPLKGSPILSQINGKWNIIGVISEGSHDDHFAVESYNGGASQNNNISVQSHFSQHSQQHIDASVFDQAFVENEQNDDTLNGDLPQSQNILDYSDNNNPLSQGEVVAQVIDNVDISKAAATEESAAGIVANSTTSVLMMSDEPSRVTTFQRFSSTNHISFGVKLEKCLDDAQRENLERILRTKMKSDVWIREEVERSQAFLRLYRLIDGQPVLLNSNAPESMPHTNNLSPAVDSGRRDRSESPPEPRQRLRSMHSRAAANRTRNREISPEERRERSRSPHHR